MSFLHHFTDEVIEAAEVLVTTGESLLNAAVATVFREQVGPWWLWYQCVRQAYTQGSLGAGVQRAGRC